MEDSAEQAGSAGSKLDALVTLVEKAAAAIAHLQAGNEALARQLHEREHAAEEAAALIAALRSELDTQGSRIAELEASGQALYQDAQWRRWFHGKYSNSLFYSTIENAYLSDHAAPGEDKNLS